MAARSKGWVCGCSIAGFVGSNPVGSMDLSLSLSCECCVCCQLREVSATGRLLVQRIIAECDVSECDLETSTMNRPRLSRAVEP